MTTLFTPQSPLGVLERFFLGTNQPEDAGILYCILFDANGNMTDPNHCGGRLLGYRPFTDAVCEHWGFDRKYWHRVVIGIFGDRAKDEYPTELLAFLTAYDALAGTAHLGDENNCSSDDQCLWQQDTEDES